jgi:RHS repeat-associated protein
MELHNNKIYKSILLVAGLLISNTIFAQTTTQNYVRSRIPRTAIKTNTRLDQLTTVKDSVMTTIQYVDGLGSPLQTVQRQASPAGYDVVQPFAYDGYYREAQKYLPYVNTSTSYGAYRTDALGATTGVKAFYNPGGGTPIDGKQSNAIVLTQFPYAVTAFEPSPLGRVIEQGAPGAAWQLSTNPDADHAVRVSFTSNEQTSTFNTANVSSTNLGSRKAAQYTATINTDGSRSLVRTGNTATYSPNQLSVTISKDENWKATDGCFGTAEEYKDKEGHIVLKRTYNINGTVAEMLSTYYVYDEKNLLSFVLPPGASPDVSGTAISQTTLDNFCYQYRYDERGRMAQKKVPGKGWEFVTYNVLDQVVFTQDAVQRNKTPQQWTYTKYDAMGRPIITGVWNCAGTTADANISAPSTASLTGIQGILNSTTSPRWETRDNTSAITGYTNVAIPQDAPATYNTITFYDDYNIPGLPSMYNQLSNTLYSSHTTGLITATKTLVLNTTGDYLWSVPYYDEDGQVIRTFMQHYLGGSSSLSQYNYDDVQPVYNFVKQPKIVVRLHNVKNSGGTATLSLTSTDEYTYDHMGRKLKSYNTLKDGANTAQARVLVSLGAYNELGQLKQKGLHSLNETNFLQNVDYRYNARGWLTNINNAALSNDQYTSTDLNDQFGMDLKYDDAATPQYNGNIGSVKTLTGTISSNTYPSLTYNYTYDKLNRLTDAISTTSAANDGFYNENMTYDQMGNIKTLKRYEKNGTMPQMIDNLNYTYLSGNKVDQIDDSGTAAGFINTVSQTGEYTYDGNGNQVTDLNRGLTQQYNMLNLPQTVTKTGVSIAYIYDATGRMLRKLVTSGSTTSITEYIAGVQYQYSTATPVLDFISTEEGRARKSGSVYKYEYDLKDHLGNTRMTTSWAAGDNTQMAVYNVGKNDYYAFGYSIGSTSYFVNPKNQYLYNHKELQEETGLYDYGARFYDPVIGRWNSIDPLAELGRRFSPYNYVENNPLRNIDPDGMWTATADGWSSDNAAEAQSFFRSLVAAQQNGGPGGEAKKKKEEAPTWYEKLWNRFKDKMMKRTDFWGGHPPKDTKYTRAFAKSMVTAGQLVLVVQGHVELVEGSVAGIPSATASVEEQGSLLIEAGAKFSQSEINAARYMESLGNDVVLRSPVGTREGGLTSDLLVNGRAFDVYTPETTNLNRIIGAITAKNTQASGIVLDLSKTSVTRLQLYNVLERVQGTGAKIRTIIIMPK